MPADALILSGLLLGCTLLGWLVRIQFRAPGEDLAGPDAGPEAARADAVGPAWVQGILAAAATGVALSGWLALLLAGLGQYALVRWLGLNLLLAALLLIRWRRSGRRFSRPAWTLARLQTGRASGVPGPGRASLSARGRPQLETLFVLLWLPMALWLFFRPHEFILGGADAGVYVNLAANIDHTGAIRFHDRRLAELDPRLLPHLLRQDANAGATPYLVPAFFVTDAASGEISPQFFHLHPVWQAVAYGLGDVTTALRLNGLWAVLGSLAFYLVARQQARWQVAALALTGLSLTGLQVWFARYPTTEIFTQFWLWIGLWSLGQWLDETSPRAFWGLLAGLAWGSVMLVRIDMVLLWLIPAGLLLWQLLQGRLKQAPARRASLWFYAPLAGLSLHAAVHSWLVSPVYSRVLLDYSLGLLQRYPFIPALALFLAGALLAGRRFLPRFELRRWRRPGLALAILVVVGLALYGWFVRPLFPPAVSVYIDSYSRLETPILDHENLRRLGWYLSPAGIWFGVAGICAWLWRADRHRLPLLAMGLTFSLLYLWRIQATPHQVYAMRRYVPVVAPFFVAAGATFLGHILFTPRDRPRATALRVLALALILAWLAGLAWSARGFVSQVDYEGLIAQYEALDRQLPAGSILLFTDQATVGQGDVLGTPLRFLYGHELFTLRDPAGVDPALLRQTIAGWQADGHPVFWVGPPPDHQPAGPGQTITLAGRALESVYDHKPSALISYHWALTLSPAPPP